MPTDVRQRKFEILATELRDQIRRGVLKPGDRLPTFAEIHLKSGITKPTIIRAQTLLEREGLITRRRGHGTFVASDASLGRPSGPMAETIAVLTPYGGPLSTNLHAPGWALFTTTGILEEAHGTGHHAIMLHPDKMRERDIDWLVTQRPFGVIIDDNYNSDIEHLRLITEAFARASVPMVVLGNMPFWSECDRVASDHEQGAYELTNWLIARGRRRILPICPPIPHLDWVSKRLVGYARAMDEAGLEPMAAVPSPELNRKEAIQADFEQYSRQCAASLIEAMTGPAPCDALLTPSDGPLLYYAAACRLFGKEPNRDILLAGYDNYWQEVPERKWETATPDVTVDKDNHRIGKELVGLLLERVTGTLPSVPQVRLIPPRLIAVAGGDRTTPPLSGMPQTASAFVSILDSTYERTLP